MALRRPDIGITVSATAPSDRASGINKVTRKPIGIGGDQETVFVTREKRISSGTGLSRRRSYRQQRDVLWPVPDREHQSWAEEHR